MAMPESGPLLPTFFGAGFECSAHRRHDGRRLDLIAATEHDRFAAEDYRACRLHGLGWARDGLRWHCIEQQPGRYDWSSWLPQLRAAEAAGVAVFWDLCHYGWPDGLDIWQPAFVDRFAQFARAAAEVFARETDAVPLWCPVNEPSYWSWAGGDMAAFNPGTHGRGFELKAQLARAAIAASEAVREVDPRARLLHADPVIHVVANPGQPHERADAEGHRLAQFQAWDMIAGQMWPQFGGRPELLDLVGVNYYDHNQWTLGGPHFDHTSSLYRPLREIMAEVHARYGRPLLIAETGTEGEARPAWLRKIAREAAAARDAGVPLHGCCLYPVTDYPGWDDERLCTTGLFGLVDASTGERPVYEPLVEELRRQRAAFDSSPAHA